MSHLLGEGTVLPISIICEVAITARVVCRSPGKGKQLTSRKAKEAAVPHLEAWENRELNRLHLLRPVTATAKR